MTGAKRKAGTEVAGNKAKTAIICACVDMSYGDMQRILSDNLGVAYQDFLSSTGAGAKCTACLLDLEYNYVQLPRLKPRASKQTNGPKSAAPKSIKERLYDWLDRLPPRINTPLRTFMPVLCGPGVEQFLWITNRTKLFKDATDIVPQRVRYRVRDADGLIVDEVERTIGANERLRGEISGGLRGTKAAKIADTPGWRVGSLEVVQRSLRPGVRGTTRPQVEWLLSGGANSLHTQGAPGGYDRIISVPYLPKQERVFFTVMNCGKQSGHYEFEYPLGGDRVSKLLDVPPYATRVHELRIPARSRDQAADRLVRVRIRGVGYGKIHLVCATRALDRISIDHI